jgi:hypothetical protein
MSNIQKPAAAVNCLLEGYISEDEMAKARGIALRTMRAERQRGDGPPWIKITRQVFYPIEGFHAWLKAIEQRPARVRKAA